ncbi:hypothetical protein ACS0PU_005314 [Formica fusca]
MEFLKYFHQFNDIQQYFIEITSSTVIHKNNDIDEICADLLSELSIINHDKELDENDNRNYLSTNNGNIYRRSDEFKRT